MKSLSTIFSGSSATAMLGWVLLFFVPQWQYTDVTILSVIAIALALIYTFLIFIKKDEAGIKYPKGNFSSLHGVVNLFKNPRAVLAGWIHYLAFDLLIGLMIKNEAQELAINHWYILPCLFLTLMFGPLGYLSFFILKLFFQL
jgi:hypothetical protein